MKFIHRIIALC